MNKAIAAIVIVVVVGVGVYLVTRPKMKNQISAPTTQQTQPASNAGSSSSMNTATSNPASANQSVTVPISAQNNSGETGTAILTDENGKTKVSVTITGEPNGATQPSHIHIGACATPGPAGAVKYTLSPLVNGKAETTIDVSLNELLKNLPLMINYHKSASEITVYTACGDIVSPSKAPVAPTPTTPPAPKYTPPTSNSGNSGGNYGY